MRSSGPRAASPDFPASPTQRARLELPFTEQTVNHYEILGVARAASEADIKKAFHRLARRWHPDKAPSGTPNWVFLKIHRAYELLSDEQRRQRKFREYWAIPPRFRGPSKMPIFKRFRLRFSHFQKPKTCMALQGH